MNVKEGEGDIRLMAENTILSTGKEKMKESPSKRYVWWVTDDTLMTWCIHKASPLHTAKIND
jgi:hypothetical protein